MTSRGDGLPYQGLPDSDRTGDRDARVARVAANRRAADAARRVLAALIASDAPPAELDAAADALTEVADRLEPHAPRSRYAGTDPIDVDGRSPDSPFRAYESHPMVGPGNALAPPLVLAPPEDEGTVVVTATYGSAYEGPPGFVHGGMLAAAFDYVHAAATMAAGIPSLTASLTVRYRSGTPLHREVRYEGRVERLDGRRIHVYATARVDGEVTAESEGVFVSVDPERFKAPDPVPAPSG